ncbi:MAG: hypothetical protein Q9176_007821 [Flavoplaca citrina]
MSTMVCQSCLCSLYKTYGQPSSTKELILWDILATVKHDLLLDYIGFRNLISWRVKKAEALLALNRCGNEGEEALAEQRKLQNCAVEFETLGKKVGALKDRFV